MAKANPDWIVEETATEPPQPQVQQPDPNAVAVAVAMIQIGLKALSQRALTAATALFSLLTIGSAFWLWWSIPTVATAGNVDANVLNSQTSNYTIQASDCGSTIQAGTGSTGFFTVTLPAVSGFNSACTVTVKNADTTRGKSLSGFPYDLNPILWPLQSLTVKIVNAGAGRGRRRRWVHDGAVDGSR
jgi:hypothetical protein